MNYAHRPIFCFGKTANTTLSSALATGETWAAFDNSAGAYAVGDEVFTGEDTIQYLGRVRQASTAGVRIEIPAEHDFVASSPIWQPATHTDFTCGPLAAGVTREISTGIEHARTVGGVLYSTRTADSYEIITLDWNGRPVGDFEKFQMFLMDERDGGLKAFTAAWHEISTGASRTAIVRCVTSELSASNESKIFESHSLTLTITSNGEYQVA